MTDPVRPLVLLVGLVLVVALVWALCAAMGLPYLLALFVTLLAALALFSGRV